MACWGPAMNASDKPALLSHEGRVVLLALLAGLPGSAAALWMLWSGDFSAKVQWTLSVLISGAWLGFAFAVRERVVFPLQTLANLLGALREGDFSVRGRSPRPDDALGEVMREINTLGSTLREQRLGAMEATTLLRTVMREIAVAIFAFDENQRLRLVNRAGERLLAAPAERLVRVLGHELNNSLTPIKSIAGSLEAIVARDPLPDDWRDDMRRGLNVIMSRSDSLSRFIG